VTKKDVYSYDTRASQPRGRTEKQDEEFIIHPNYLRDMKRGEAVCRIVYVSGPKVFKMKLKEVQAPPTGFDYVKCVPVRNNHLSPMDSNKVVIVNAVKESKPKSKDVEKPAVKTEKSETVAKGSFAGHRNHFQTKAQAPKSEAPTTPVEKQKGDKKPQEETPT
jgi:hypothetical protein